MRTRETEIKLLFDPSKSGKIERRLRHSRKRAAARKERTTYFDTDNLELRNRGYSLRVRRSGKSHVQTFKHTDAGSAVVGQRREWEWPVRSGDLDTRPLAALARRHEALDGEYARASPKFVTEIRRKSYTLRLDEGTRIEAVIDRGIIRVGASIEPVNELELEIKDGPVAPAYRLALNLARENAMRLGVESKADRGYRLCAGKPAGAEKSRAIMLPRRAGLKQAVALSAGAALNQFLANMPAAHEGNVEGVHQMRVSLRRLRTMLVLFAPCIQREPRGCFNDAIRKLGMPLGVARDWDVLVLETLPQAACEGLQAEWIAELKKRADGRRKRAHLGVRSLIDGPGPTQLVLEIAAWAAEGEWITGGADASTPAADVLPDLLARMLHKVRKRAKGLPDLLPHELHPLRKSVKKLRYGSEMAVAFFKEKRVASYVRRCKKLQTVLGEINDAITTRRLVRGLSDLEISAATEALLMWNDTRLRCARKGLASAWRKLDAAEPFWR